MGGSIPAWKRIGPTAIAAVLLAGCAGEAPAFQVRDVGVVIRSSAAFVAQDDFPTRIESTLDVAVRYWGGDWDALRGKTVTFEGEAHVDCAGHGNAVGCYDGDIRVSTRDVDFVFYCVEETALVHEVGHAVIGDADHTDPRWMDFAAVVASLQGRPGYASGNEVPCALYPSVWQHLPPAPATAVRPPALAPPGLATAPASMAD